MKNYARYSLISSSWEGPAVISLEVAQRDMPDRYRVPGMCGI